MAEKCINISVKIALFVYGSINLYPQVNLYLKHYKRDPYMYCRIEQVSQILNMCVLLALTMVSKLTMSFKPRTAVFHKNRLETVKKNLEV